MASDKTGSDRKPKEDPEKKKLRNRLAQRAFRRRQANRLQELLSHVDSNGQPQDETIRVLREENKALRNQLLSVHTKMSRLMVTIQDLSGSVLTSLGETQSETEETGLPDPPASLTGPLPSSSSSPPAISQGGDLFDPMFPQSDSLVHPSQTSTENTELLPEITPLLDNMNTSIPCPVREIPNVWTYTYQTGPGPYTDAVSRRQEPSLILGKAWTETNSPFSDHIQVLRHLLKAKVQQNSPAGSPTIQLFYQEVMMLLALFNSLTRPDVMRWYAKTRFYYIVNLTAWQVYPCPKTYNAIHPLYRPTPIQMKYNYPCVIDWIPFPSIRDRLIELYAANPQIDQIFCDTVSSYVVETWMSDLIIGAPVIKAYIRVTDLIANIDSSNADSEPEAFLPAPDVATLFSSQAWSSAVFRLLNINSGMSQYKIDPAFFGSYPDLYDHTANVAAEGIPLRPDVQHRLSCPRPLGNKTFQTYRAFIDFSHDSPLKVV